MKTKSSLYRDRLLRERPTHTKGGTPIEIDPSGNYVRTLRNGARNGSHSVYTLCDYPNLFGWDRVGHQKRKPKQSNHIIAVFGGVPGTIFSRSVWCMVHGKACKVKLKT